MLPAPSRPLYWLLLPTIVERTDRAVLPCNGEQGKGQGEGPSGYVAGCVLHAISFTVVQAVTQGMLRAAAGYAPYSQELLGRSLCVLGVLTDLGGSGHMPYAAGFVGCVLGTIEWAGKPTSQSTMRSWLQGLLLLRSRAACLLHLPYVRTAARRGGLSKPLPPCFFSLLSPPLSLAAWDA